MAQRTEAVASPLSRGRAALGARVSSGFSFRTFDSLREKDFAWFFAAMLGQMAAMNMQMLVRGFLTYELTGSYAKLGIVGLASALPMLSLSVIGGVIADSAPRKLVLQVGQTFSAIVAVIMGVLLFLDMLQFWHLLGAAAAHGVVIALMMPSRQAYIPDVVGRSLMMNAVSLNAAGMNLMRLLAPALGGFLIVWIGASWVYFVMAGFYSIAVITLLKVRAHHTDHVGAARRKDNSRGGARDLVAGLRYIIHEPTIFAILAISFVTSMLAMPYLQLLPGYVADVFDGGAGALGVMIAVSGAGALAGALVIASLPERRRGLLLLASAIVIGAGLIVFALMPGYLMALPLMIVIGVGTAGRQALGNVLLQEYVDDDYRGRVMSLFMTQFSLMQMGTFIVGIIAGVIGARMAFGGLGVVLIIVTLLALALVPRLRRLE